MFAMKRTVANIQFSLRYTDRLFKSYATCKLILSRLKCLIYYLLFLFRIEKKKIVEIPVTFLKEIPGDIIITSAF